jgi:hypothetical protein
MSSPDVVWVFMCSSGDDDEIAACKKLGWTITMDEPAGRGDFARKMNHAYLLAADHCFDWIFQAADDVRFQPGWDTALLNCAEKTGALVIGTQDGGNPSVKAGRHSTHTLIARSYIDSPGASWDGPGTVFSEAYSHQMCDVELVELAKARRVWAFCAKARVLHEHPLWNRSVPTDATYAKGATGIRADQRLYLQRSRSWRGKRLALPASR